MAEVRARRPINTPAQKQQEEDTSKTKPLKKRDAGPDLEPNIFVVVGLFVIFSVVLGTFFWYKVENRDGGPFAAWVNEKYPAIDRVLNKQTPPLFGAAAAEATGKIKLTEEELKAYDGTNDMPIYLAIDGTIFDVSISPAFYGPGGHYHHFVGKDATRAWITECWDEPDQFTWRLDDVEVMFMNKYLDESLEGAIDGDFEGMGDLGENTQNMMAKIARQAMEKLGPVSEKEKQKRRKVDIKEAKAKAQETLDHWKKFFADNEKYKTVGEVILDETRPAPPKPCKKALEKRPMKGGKLEAMMGAKSNLGQMGGGAGKGGAAGKDKGGSGQGPMADVVKAMQKDKEAKKKAEEAAKAKAKGDEDVEFIDLEKVDYDDDMYHEEL